MLVDDVDDIDFGEQLVYKFGWNHGGVWVSDGLKGWQNWCFLRLRSCVGRILKAVESDVCRPSENKTGVF